MAVRRKLSNDHHVHQMTPSELGWPPLGRGRMDALPSVLCRQEDEPISLGLQSANLGKVIARFTPDIVNLHWINGGIASIRAVGKLSVPAVWTLHDMWPFTGGCHYSGKCLKYRKSCEVCPKIKPFFGASSVTSWVHYRKRKHWGTRKAYAITPSAWMKNLALTSSLLADAEIRHIRNCVDSAVFCCSNRQQIRNQLGLPDDATAVLFSGANQPRKGALIIPEIIGRLRAAKPATNYRFLFMGGLPPQLESGSHVIDLPATTDESRVARYYSASDLYVLPSFEDNLPNTISESLSCGTPVVAFPAGGIVEMIRHGRNGALSAERTAASMAEAIGQFAHSRREKRDEIARDASRTYDPSTIAHSHRSFFMSVLGYSG